MGASRLDCRGGASCVVLSLFSPAFAELALANAPSSIAIFDGDIYNFGRISGTYYVVPSRTIRT
jgi:hypothetical protein